MDMDTSKVYIFTPHTSKFRRRKSSLSLTVEKSSWEIWFFSEAAEEILEQFQRELQRGNSCACVGASNDALICSMKNFAGRLTDFS